MLEFQNKYLVTTLFSDTNYYTSFVHKIIYTNLNLAGSDNSCLNTFLFAVLIVKGECCIIRIVIQFTDKIKHVNKQNKFSPKVFHISDSDTLTTVLVPHLAHGQWSSNNQTVSTNKIALLRITHPSLAGNDTNYLNSSFNFNHNSFSNCLQFLCLFCCVLVLFIVQGVPKVAHLWVGYKHPQNWGLTLLIPGN